MKTRIAMLAIVLGIGLTSFVISGEHPRYVRGTGLAGLADPNCAVCADPYCPACAPLHAHKPIGFGRPMLGGWHHGLGYLGSGPQQSIQPGPPTAAITYPYYTLRGPRDFLQRELSPIGP